MADMHAMTHSTTAVVSDQNASLDFYVNRLGWSKGIDSMLGPDIRLLTVVPPGAGTQLVLADSRWVGSEPAGRQTGISLVADDLEAASRTLKQRGVRVAERIGLTPWGAKAAGFYDLDGNEFFLIEG
jgi:catechol 2,3-dioxygenase-like lactoylglutathione lyase family enzyme